MGKQVPVPVCMLICRPRIAKIQGNPGTRVPPLVQGSIHVRCTVDFTVPIYIPGDTQHRPGLFLPSVCSCVSHIGDSISELNSISPSRPLLPSSSLSLFFTLDYSLIYSTDISTFINLISVNASFPPSLHNQNV